VTAKRKRAAAMVTGTTMMMMMAAAQARGMVGAAIEEGVLTAGSVDTW
jgi:hypothetical protein